MSNRAFRRSRYRDRPNPEQKPAIPAEPIRIDPDAQPPEVERVELFFIRDKAYTIPKELDPSVGLRYLRNTRYLGPDSAFYELMVEVLTEDGFDALADCKVIGKKQMGEIVDAVMTVAMSNTDPGKG